MGIVERVCFIGKKTKNHIYRHLKTMRECMNPALYPWIVIEHISTKVAKFRGVPLQGGALERFANIGFDKGSASESYKALKTLHKEQNVLIIDVFSYQHYPTFSVCPIKVRVEIAQVGLIPSFCYDL